MYELNYAFRCPHIYLNDRQELVFAGPCGKANSMAKSNKPFHKLTKHDLVKELNARSIFDGDKKSQLEDLLKEELHGVQRVPALLSDQTLESINCASYRFLVLNPFMILESISKIY